MDELKMLSDSQLASRMINYIERIQKLMNLVSAEIHDKGCKTRKDSIYQEYRVVKQSIKEDANYLHLSRNRKNDRSVSLYNSVFEPSITEAAAWGFTSYVNSRIDSELLNSLDEARYKLTKHYNLDEWKNVLRDN